MCFELYLDCNCRTWFLVGSSIGKEYWSVENKLDMNYPWWAEDTPSWPSQLSSQPELRVRALGQEAECPVLLWRPDPTAHRPSGIRGERTSAHKGPARGCSSTDFPGSWTTFRASVTLKHRQPVYPDSFLFFFSVFLFWKRASSVDEVLKGIHGQKVFKNHSSSFSPPLKIAFLADCEFYSSCAERDRVSVF